jgi:preprotein translocase SecE subunit
MAIKLPSRANVFARAPQSGAQRRPGPARVNPLTQFVRESRIELRKVVWPTRQEATRLTMVVIAVSAGTGLILGGFDYGIAQLFSLVAH